MPIITIPSTTPIHGTRSTAVPGQAAPGRSQGSASGSQDNSASPARGTLSRRLTQGSGAICLMQLTRRASLVPQARGGMRCLATTRSPSLPLQMGTDGRLQEAELLLLRPSHRRCRPWPRQTPRRPQLRTLEGRLGQISPALPPPATRKVSSVSWRCG
jgi:hypothetical protein